MSKKLIEVWEYLALTADDYASNETGLKDEFKGLIVAGYCVALQHLAYALNLPVEMEDLEDDSVACKRIRAHFPAPPEKGADNASK